MPKPEEQARKDIDAALTATGWTIQDRNQANVQAARAIAVREFLLADGYGYADYLLYLDGKALGVVEAKKAGSTLTGVELQSGKYGKGLPPELPAHRRPLPFLYESTGVETRFTNQLDPEPKSRQVFGFHRAETFGQWLAADALPAEPSKPSTLHSRLRTLPPLIEEGLRVAQVKAVKNLEVSLADNRPRALIQMATGSGKTIAAINSIYRLIKFGGARRVLFLVDRGNLGRQALKEFQAFSTPDDGRKFTELYNVQHLTSNKVDPVAKVCISTIQRLFSMLSGKELDPTLEEGSAFDTSSLVSAPVPVSYNPALPIEYFDFIFTDECHRSIYNLWRQVLEYFDAYLIGLTATPSKQTLGFFNQNLVMEYGHQQAVADGVNVDFDLYRIRTEITQKGSKVDAGLFVDKRDRADRTRRWEQLDQDLQYSGTDLDRSVVAMDQIRTVIKTFKEKLHTEIFPGRTEVPKTLIFAKDDSHADDIVQVVRDEFGKGNDFAQKITYKTTGAKPEDLIASFRNSYNPRIVVTVDMIATGTDIKPIEIVMFMREVKSRIFFEQMKGRGVRVISGNDLKAVTPDAEAKDRFVIVDCVGLCEQPLSDTRPLEREPGVSLEKLLDRVAFGTTDKDILSTLAGRLARLSRRLGKPEREQLQWASGGASLEELSGSIVQALDPDVQEEAARQRNGLAADVKPTEEQVKQAAEELIKRAVEPFVTKPGLRNKIVEFKKRFEQTIDTVSKDRILEASYSAEAKERAESLVKSFEKFIEDNKDEITALQVLYSRPYAQRLRFADVKALADTIGTPPRSWTPERLWAAYEALDKTKVKRGSGPRLLTDLVSLVRFAVHQENELVPFSEKVEERYNNWLAQQQSTGRAFTPEQLQWLALIKDHVAASMRIEKDDFEDVPFNQKGGLGKVYQIFGEQLEPLLEELNQVLVA